MYIGSIMRTDLITVAPKTTLVEAKELLEKQIEVVKQSVVKDMLGDEYEHFRTLRKVKATYGIQARIPYDLKPL